ncbi:MAG: hypothetical protein ACREN6_16515 [Gemmatimonadaceae bacterium]
MIIRPAESLLNWLMCSVVVPLAFVVTVSACVQLPSAGSRANMERVEP